MARYPHIIALNYLQSLGLGQYSYAGQTRTMVLKLCGGLWPPSRTDDDLDVAANHQQRLQEVLREDSRARRESNAAMTRFAKEVRIAFDSRRDHGLSLGAANDDGCPGYGCAVTSIEGQSAEYNAKCRAMGDYSLMLVEGMRVRAVNSHAMKGVGVEKVFRQLTKASGGGSGLRYTVTFADVSSKPTSPKPKPRGLGSVVLAVQASQRSPLASPTRQSLSRSVYNAQASPKVSKWSSVLTAVSETVRTNQSQSDVLASDLTHKNAALEAQLLVLKGTLASLEREKAALEQQREATAEEMAGLLNIIHTERRDAQSKHAEVSDNHAVTAERVRALERENEAMRAEATAMQTAMETLQHEHDAVLLQMQELQVEHRDAQHQAEELHSRLVVTQLAKSEVHEQLTMLKHAQHKDQAAVAAIQSELSQSDGQIAQRRRSSVSAVVTSEDSPLVSLLKRTLQSRETLQTQNDELQIELSCHETTIQHQHEKILELEDKLAAITQISDSLRDQVRTLMAVKPPHILEERDEQLHTPVAGKSDRETDELRRRLQTEQTSNARLQAALQTLEDKARAKLEQYEKEQRLLAQFKEQLVRGIAVTKYGARGSPHTRVLFSDAPCRWISWRSPSDGASTSPRADAKAETMDLVEILLGATTETFQAHKPEVPARCLSLVFCHPCRTLDLEVETRERALFLRRGFRLLLEAAAEKRRVQEDEDTGVLA